MKISDKILSLPPYLSTPWKNVIALHVEPRPYGLVLAIDLATGVRIEVPNLDKPTIEKIFEMHAQTFEEDKKIQIVFPLGAEGFSSMMQHNMDKADSADLPPELLEKAAAMTKSLGLFDASSLPQAEPHCNCPHCQILRALHETPKQEQIEEEAVSDADLQFRTWDISQEADKLYTVKNPLDEKEHYSVFLGKPLGCTCGQKNCEHIQAVLKS